MRKLLDFEEDGLRCVHALMEELDVPVIMASYSEADDGYISEIIRKVKAEHVTTDKVCELCDFYGIDYRALYRSQNVES